ncbi:MAG: DUF2007 domain-containing protein [Akkermansiaceae bacterium]|nr:DUF2007 domain-containing protein [Akkermansiaceae bacterium]
MKELFRHRDHTLVSYYRGLLEAEGIPVIMRNEYLAMSGLTEIPITEFYPNICVLHDEDYERAWKVMRRAIHENARGSDTEVTCAECGESNPGNFEVCFSCGKALGTAADGERESGGA